MGGKGSGWRGPKRDVVEDCLVLSIHELIREGAIIPGCFRHGLWNWSYEDADEPHATICYEGDLRNRGAARLRLTYTDNDAPVSQYIWLTTTKPHYGGLRWWFRCPSRNIRVGKLYLPPGGCFFASRQAHGLTYTSCQRSGARERFWRQMARDLERYQAIVREGDTEARASAVRTR